MPYLWSMVLASSVEKHVIDWGTEIGVVFWPSFAASYLINVSVHGICCQMLFPLATLKICIYTVRCMSYVIIIMSYMWYYIKVEFCTTFLYTLYYCVLVTRIFKYCVVGIWPWRVCVSWQHPSSHMILSRNIRKLLSMLWRSAMLQYNTIRDVVLTCAQKLTWVSA